MSNVGGNTNRHILLSLSCSKMSAFHYTIFRTNDLSFDRCMETVLLVQIQHCVISKLSLFTVLIVLLNFNLCFEFCKDFRVNCEFYIVWTLDIVFLQKKNFLHYPRWAVLSSFHVNFAVQLSLIERISEWPLLRAKTYTFGSIKKTCTMFMLEAAKYFVPVAIYRLEAMISTPFCIGWQQYGMCRHIVLLWVWHHIITSSF